MARLCFVVMPFGSGSEYSKGKKESTFVFERIIKPAVSAAIEEIGVPDQEPVFRVIRELDEVTPGSITTRISDVRVPSPTNSLPALPCLLPWLPAAWIVHDAIE